MDCIAYHQCGIEYAVAPLGTALTDEQVHLVRPFTDEVLLSFDADGAGQKATMRAMLMLRRAGITVRIIQLVGGKDPAEIMINYGAEALTNAVSNAILDSDFLLSKLGSEYSVDTPEGKTKASLAFFTYVDALQSDIQKESCLEQLCQAFNLKPEAVKRDFLNREKAHERLNNRQPSASSQPQKIKLTAELRSVLAVMADLDKYKMMRAELSADDFEDFSAKQLFTILEECFKDNSLSLTGVLNRCKDGRLADLITSVVSLGEYRDNTRNAVQDSIRMIKRRSLERRRNVLMERLRHLSPVTADDKEQLREILREKMEIDRKLLQ